MSYSAIEAHNRAAEIVKVGLQSGAIKLNGNTAGNHLSVAHTQAEADAKYLSTLISQLSAFIQQIK